MTISIITPTSKKELKAALTSELNGRSYNYFKGEIRKEDKYVKIHYYFVRNKITIQILYWQDGIDHAIEAASNCSTLTGVVNKVAKFLDLK